MHTRPILAISAAGESIPLLPNLTGMRPDEERSREVLPEAGPASTASPSQAPVEALESPSLTPTPGPVMRRKFAIALGIGALAGSMFEIVPKMDVFSFVASTGHTSFGGILVGATVGSLLALAFVSPTLAGMLVGGALGLAADGAFRGGIIAINEGYTGLLLLLGTVLGMVLGGIAGARLEGGTAAWGTLRRQHLRWASTRDTAATEAAPSDPTPAEPGPGM